MAVPTLPTAKNTNDVIDNSWVDAVRDVLEFLRDTAPIFKGESYSNGTANQDIANATVTTFGFGSAGAFAITPEINIGGWTVQASDGDPESLVVPEAGYYAVTIHAEFAANTSGRRQTSLLLNGSTVNGSRVRIAASTSSTTAYTHTVMVDLAANDELDISAYQDSGSALDPLTIRLTAQWIRST